MEIFKRERKNPAANFEESHFMDYLTHPAHPKNTIKNSFRGVRKYYRFMDQLELEFAICFSICFSLSDLDRYYSIDSLTKKVLQRIGKGKGNRMILQRRLETKGKMHEPHYWIELILGTSTIGFFIWQGLNWISILVAGIFGFAIYWILNSKIYDKKHNQKLALIIELV